MRRFLRDGGWAALVFMLIGLGLGWWSAVSATQSARFTRDGVTIMADVTDRRDARHRSSQGRSRTRYYVSVAYVPPGETTPRTAEEQVSEDFHDAAVVGRQIAVRILPDAPERIQIEPGRLGRTAWITGITGAVFAGFSLWMGMQVRRSIAWADRLAMHGVATVGRVVRVANGKKSVTLHWTYQPPLGVALPIATRVPAASALAGLSPGTEFPARFDPVEARNAAPLDL